MTKLTVRVRFGLALLLGALAVWPLEVRAYPNGQGGVSPRDTSSGCGGCHSQDMAIQVAILGSNSLAAGATDTYTIRARKQGLGSGAVMGFLVAAGDSPSPLNEGNLNTTHNAGTREVYHNWVNNTYPLNTTAVVNDGGINYGTATYTFTFTMPAGAAPASPHVLYSVAVLGMDTGGGAQTQWNGSTANNFTIYVPPTAPSGLSASNVQGSSVTLSWSGGGPNYRIVYKTGSAPVSPTDGTPLNVTSSPSTVTGLAPSTLYYFAVYSKVSAADVFSATATSTTATTAAAPATNRYVSTTGTNSGNCTVQASPCRTLTYAMAQANTGSPGDTIIVAPGTYNTALGEVFPISIKSGVALTGSGDPTTVIVDAAGANKRVFDVSTSNSFTLLQGFTIRGGRSLASVGTDAYGGAMIIFPPFAQSAQIRVNGNIFTDNEVRGADGNAGSPDASSAYGGAISIAVSTASSPVISNNVFVNNRAIGGNGHSYSNATPGGYPGGGLGGAIDAAGSGSALPNAVTIVNNTFHNNVAQGGNGGSSVGAAGRDGGGSVGSALWVKRAIVRNNIYANNSGLGGTGGTGSPAGGPGAGGGAVGYGEASVTSSNNLFFGNVPDAGSLGAAPVQADPLFFSAPNNLRPQATSPARGAGTNTNAPTADFDGIVRPLPPTIGAFEARPAAPGSLTAANIGPTSLTLSWTGGGPSYRIVYKTGASAPASPTDGTTIDTTGTSTTVGGLNPSTQYSFAAYSKFVPEDIYSHTAATATATTGSLVTGARYVNAASGVNTGNCTAAASPCKTITYAMAQASGGTPGDAVNVAPGTYDSALGEVFPIVVKSGVQLQATGNASNTTIDASGANQRVLAMAQNAHSSTLLQGFTITGGLQTSTDGAISRGGALFIDQGSPTIRKNAFVANEARGYAGAGSTYVSGGEAYGGAIYVTTGTPTIVNNVFRGNIARGGNGKSNPGLSTPGSQGGGGSGGAIWMQSGPGGGAINNNTFHGNSAIGGNGGSSLGAGGNGGNASHGALYSSGVSVNNNIFSANGVIAGDGGGGSPAGVDGFASYGAMQYNSPPADASNNLFHANTTDGAASTGDTIGTNSRCFLTPCASVDFHGAPVNLRILPSSPAAGQGTATGAPADDFDGVARANPPSIGAFEPSSLTYNLVLEGYQQVGPYVATPASGGGTATYNPGTRQLTFNLTYSGLTGSESAAHVHGPAARGANAGVLHNLSGANPKTDTVTLTTQQETQLFAGELYVNIHTSTYGSGELRAQIDNVGATVVRALTVSKTGTGSGTVSGTTEAGTVVSCGSDCSENVPHGKAATLTATAASGSTFGGWSGACTGTGQCVVTMDAAKTVTATFTQVASSNPPRLFNIATRGPVYTGDNVMIAGFIIGGSVPKQVLVRARGPSLTQFGVPGVLQNPQMQLYTGQTPIEYNDNWVDSPNMAAIQATGFAPDNAQEAAILITLPPGGHTAIVSGVGNTTGIAIVEVFEVGAATTGLHNIATRGQTQTNDNVMIAGFIIHGDGPQTVLIRARGPSLTQFGVPGVLPNPKLDLYVGQTVIASNDNWVDSPDQAAIQASGNAPGDPSEAAILTTLQPGGYTAIVTGVGGGTGVAIVEVFRN